VSVLQVNIETFFCGVKGQGSFCKHFPLATSQAMKSELILKILWILVQTVLPILCMQMFAINGEDRKNAD